MNIGIFSEKKFLYKKIINSVDMNIGILGGRTIGMRTIGMRTIGMRTIGMEDNWHAENWHGG